MARFFLRCVAAFVILTVPSISLAQKAVIVVRHAESEETPERRLNAAGLARAQALARVLKDAGITAIVRSDMIRAKQTAEPTAEQAKKQCGDKFKETEVKYDTHHVANAWKAIQEAGPEAVVLYVGHADTVVPLLAKMGYDGPFSFEDPHGNLVVCIPRDTGSTFVRLHYSKE